MSTLVRGRDCRSVITLSTSRPPFFAVRPFFLLLASLLVLSAMVSMCRSLVAVCPFEVRPFFYGLFSLRSAAISVSLSVRSVPVFGRFFGSGRRQSLCLVLLCAVQETYSVSVRC